MSAIVPVSGINSNFQNCPPLLITNFSLVTRDSTNLTETVTVEVGANNQYYPGDYVLSVKKDIQEKNVTGGDGGSVTNITREYVQGSDINLGTLQIAQYFEQDPGISFHGFTLPFDPESPYDWFTFPRTLDQPLAFLSEKGNPEDNSLNFLQCVQNYLLTHHPRPKITGIRSLSENQTEMTVYPILIDARFRVLQADRLDSSNSLAGFSPICDWQTNAYSFGPQTINVSRNSLTGFYLIEVRR